MKAKKTNPKSVRLNIKDFEIGMKKGQFESVQDMIDFLLYNYVHGENVKLIAPKTEQNLSQISTKNETSLSKAEMWKLIKDGKI